MQALWRRVAAPQNLSEPQEAWATSTRQTGARCPRRLWPVCIHAAGCAALASDGTSVRVGCTAGGNRRARSSDPPSPLWPWIGPFSGERACCPGGEYRCWPRWSPAMVRQDPVAWANPGPGGPSATPGMMNPAKGPRRRSAAREDRPCRAAAGYSTVAENQHGRGRGCAEPGAPDNRLPPATGWPPCVQGASIHPCIRRNRAAPSGTAGPTGR